MHSLGRGKRETCGGLAGLPCAATLSNMSKSVLTRGACSAQKWFCILFRLLEDFDPGTMERKLTCLTRCPEGALPKKPEESEVLLAILNGEMMHSCCMCFAAPPCTGIGTCHAGGVYVQVPENCNILRSRASTQCNGL